MAVAAKVKSVVIIRQEAAEEEEEAEAVADSLLMPLFVGLVVLSPGCFLIESLGVGVLLLIEVFSGDLVDTSGFPQTIILSGQHEKIAKKNNKKCCRPTNLLPGVIISQFSSK